MSLTENTGNMVMPVGPMGGYGGGYGGFGDSLFWIIVLFLLFLFAFMGNGFGNGFGNGGMMPFMMNQNAGADVQRGFDQQAIMNGIGGIQSGINSLAQQQCNGFSAAEIAANGRQSNGMYMDDPDMMSYGWNIQRTHPYMDDMNGMSGRRGRSSVTGRYISRGMDSSNTNGMNYGQSGHSIKDRMIATLEQQMDNANSSYERQMIQEEINHIRMRNR